MLETLKVLAQSIPSANNLTDIYTVPSTTSVSISSIIICNQNNINEIVFRISIAIAGEADDVKQYIYRDLPLSPNDTFIATIGVSLGSGDIIRVFSDTDNVSFNLFGVEIS
jgi:hypothetical protein